MAEIRKYVTHNGANPTYASDIEEINNIICAVASSLPFNTPSILTNGIYSGGAYTAGCVMISVSGVNTIFGYPSGLTYEVGKYLYCKIEDDTAEFSERTDSESEEQYYQYKKYTQFTSTSGSLADNTTIFLVGQISDENIKTWKSCLGDNTIGYKQAISGQSAMADASYTNNNVGTHSIDLFGNHTFHIGSGAIAVHTFNLSTQNLDSYAYQKKSYCIAFDVVVAPRVANFTFTFNLWRYDGSITRDYLATFTGIYSQSSVVRVYLGYDAVSGIYFSNMVTIIPEVS